MNLDKPTFVATENKIYLCIEAQLQIPFQFLKPTAAPPTYLPITTPPDDQPTAAPQDNQPTAAPPEDQSATALPTNQPDIALATTVPPLAIPKNWRAGSYDAAAKSFGRKREISSSKARLRQ